MFRTRDFILIFTTVVFLLVAIGVTIFNQHRVSNNEYKSVILANVTDKEYSAEVFIPEPISREERLVNMRQKISEGEDITLSTPEPAVENVAEVASEEEVDVEIVIVQKCPEYREFSGSWQVKGVQFDVTEGARIVYRENLSEKSSGFESSASGTVSLPETKRDILLQLPIHFSPALNSSCLQSDVVGIAQDGSLIRNNESGLYSVFGANTLIGYALDGFPIYGVSNTSGDKCGGQIVNGQYGYYLSDERDVVLNCFSAQPVKI